MTPRDQWLEWRRGGIGASDIAAARSGRYGGSYGVVASKRGDEIPHDDRDPRVARGHRWETRIADAVHVLTGLHVIGEQMMLQSASNPRHRATADGFLSRTPSAALTEIDCGFEAKTFGRGIAPQWSSWITQVQWLMHVAGLDRCLIAAAEIDDTDDELLGLDLRWIDRDQDTIDTLVALACRLLAHVDAGTYPTPADSALDIVKWRHRQADTDAVAVDLTALAQSINRLSTLKHAIRANEREVNEIEAVLRERIGSGISGLTDDWRVTISKPRLELTTDAALRVLAARPDLAKTVLDRDAAKGDPTATALIDSLKTPSGSRTITITRLKEAAS